MYTKLESIIIVIATKQGSLVGHPVIKNQYHPITFLGIQNEF